MSISPRRFTIGLLASLLVASSVWSSSNALAGYPGDNGLIVFTSLVEGHDEDGSRAPEVFVANADGSNAQRLTFDAGYPANLPGATDYQVSGSELPAWSPNGQEIAFIHLGRDGHFSIEKMTADGSDRTTVSSQYVPASKVAWSPDGGQLAFSGVARTDAWPPEDGIWIIDSDGTGGTLIVPDEISGDSGLTFLHNVAWSPSSDRLAFTAMDTSTNAEGVYLASTDGSDLIRLETGCARPWALDWSPDGTRLVVECRDELVIVEADGSGLEGVPVPDGDADSPSWSPDGSTILFTTAGGGQDGLWSYDVAGHTTARIGDFEGMNVDWQPLVVFTDVVGNIFRSDIEWLAAEGITKGCNPPDNTRYCPHDHVTRGQMAAFLVRALGYTDSGEGDLFTDDDGSVFEAAIDKLATAGVTKGCNPPDNTRYCPHDYVTRGQMAAFLVRALGYTESGEGDLFTDDDGSIFESHIEKLATAGVTKGCNPPSNDRFCPNQYVTRGQMAAFLHRADATLHLSVVTSSLPIATVGVPFSADLVAQGGVPPLQWSLIAGELPTGLTFGQSGTVNGTPTTAMESTFTVAVSDTRQETASATVTARVVEAGRIGFIRSSLVVPGRTNGSICLIGSSGGAVDCLTDGTGNEHAMAWSPDRQLIAFTSYRYEPTVGYETNLYVMGSDGSGVVAVTADTEYQKDPAFSPDGTRIAFARGSYGAEDIFTVAPDGSELQQLTFNGQGNRSPTWSPDGGSIAFVSTRDYDTFGFDIYVMDSDGGNPHPVSQHPNQDLNPDWSPDGLFITFDTLRGDGCNAVYVMDADGSNPRFIACGVEPDFSPDGTEIAYESWYGVPSGEYVMNTRLFVVNRDGTNRRDLFGADETTVEHPAWS